MFDIIITVDKVKHPKPSPEGLNVIRDTLKLNSNEIVYIGDHYNDMICAKEALVYFGHAKWDNDIEQLDTKYVFDKPSKVLKFIQ